MLWHTELNFGEWEMKKLQKAKDKQSLKMNVDEYSMLISEYMLHHIGKQQC